MSSQELTKTFHFTLIEGNPTFYVSKDLFYGLVYGDVSALFDIPEGCPEFWLTVTTKQYWNLDNAYHAVISRLFSEVFGHRLFVETRDNEWVMMNGSWALCSYLSGEGMPKGRSISMYCEYESSQELTTTQENGDA